MVRPTRVSLARTAASSWPHELFGCDPTTGIVSVQADSAGRARVWRRAGPRLELTEHTFSNWFLATSLELLDHLSVQPLGAGWLRQPGGEFVQPDPLSAVELDLADVTDDQQVDAYRYLVLTSNLREIETALVETANKRYGGEAETLADLRGLVLMWPPVEQFLMLSGRTYFKGMAFDELRRMQFDLETTGLNEERDRIFMISMRDSVGWRDSLDTTTLTEAQVVERFVQVVRERDPDTLENHNIFGFDLSFLVRRAGRLGVSLAIGRDGSEPWLETDVFDSGERPEPFLRWRVAGREVIDTQHAVRRFGASAPDMRRHGLKDAARYFGFARTDREYVPGAEVWPTYRLDPARIRRYAADDVDEVDGLSRRLLPPMFELATMLPRPYERIAADAGAASLWEPLLVRAYLAQGLAISAPTPRQQRPDVLEPSEMFTRGVVGRSVRAAVRPLLPCVVAERGIAAPNDVLEVMPRLVAGLLDSEPQGEHEGARLLAAAAHPYLAGQGLFSDPSAASAAMMAARLYTDRVLDDFRSRGCTPVEVHGEEVVIGVPPAWSPALERDVAEAAAAYLPPPVKLEFVSRYESLYARAPGATMTLDSDGSVTLIGPAFRSGRLERFGETFLQRAALCCLRGDIFGMRQAFLETVHGLRSRQIPLEDLCVRVTLHKSPRQYRGGGSREEPYEAMLTGGVRSWRIGQRIRYFHAPGGELRLLSDGEAVSSADDADVDYYIERLVGLYCQQFTQAFRRDDYAAIFRLPGGVGPFDVDASEMAGITPIMTPAH